MGFFHISDLLKVVGKKYKHKRSLTWEMVFEPFNQTSVQELVGCLEFEDSIGISYAKKRNLMESGPSPPIFGCIRWNRFPLTKATCDTVSEPVVWS